MDPFEILGVSTASTDAEVRGAFRSKSLITHPDKRPSCEADIAAKEFADLVSCYLRISKQSERHAEWVRLGKNKTVPFASDVNTSQPTQDIGYQCKIVELELEQVYEGTQMPVVVSQRESSGTNGIGESCVYIDIPKGTDTGEILSTTHRSFGREERIDVKVCVNKHEKFQRKGLDLIYEHCISLKEALCGFSCQIEHISGRKISLNCSGKVISPETVQRIQGMGLQRGDKTGVLAISFKIQFPKTISDEARVSFERFL